MENKIVGTNIIKSKYILEELTNDDLQYLRRQNISCYKINLPYYNKYIFTGYKQVNKFIMNNFPKTELKERLIEFEGKRYELEINKKFNKKNITMRDLIRYVSHIIQV